MNGFLNNILNDSTNLALFSALIGAISGWTLTRASEFLTTRENTKASISLLKIIAETNKIRCEGNLGVLNNESRNSIKKQRLTMNSLVMMEEYPVNITFSQVSFKPIIRAIINIQISSLNSHNLQLENTLERRGSLEVYLRKEKDSRIEMELISLREEYNQHLKSKYEDIISFTDDFIVFLNLNYFQKLLFTSPVLRFLIRKLSKLSPDFHKEHEEHMTILKKFMG